MKWNDVELIDGKFYFVEVERWWDGKPNNWLFSYKENECFLTEHYVAVKVCVPYNRYGNVYYSGHVCDREKIVSIRPATRDDMDYFFDYLSRLGYKYSVNTKKLRHVGNR